MHNLMEWKQAQAVVQFQLFWAGAWFWVAGSVGMGAMPASIYGADVAAVPVTAWAGSILAASTIYHLGILINGHWRWSAALRLFGAMFHVAVFAAFLASAITADAGVLICSFGSGFLGLNLWFTWLNLIDVIGAVRRWGDG